MGHMPSEPHPIDLDTPPTAGVVEFGPEPTSRRRWSTAGFGHQLASDRRLVPIAAALGAVALLASLISEWQLTTVDSTLFGDGEVGERLLPTEVTDLGALGTGYLVGLFPLIAAVVLVNALVSLRAAQPILEQLQGRPYTWSPASEATADRMDLVTRAAEFGDTPVRLIVGADDHPGAIVAPARELAAALRVGDLVEIAGLAHPLADEPGVAPAPQWELAREVDRFASEWLAHHVA